MSWTTLFKNAQIDNLVRDDNINLEAFRQCPLDKLKVIILGQDPYNRGKNHTGMAFSLPAEVPVSGTLQNIYTCLYKNKQLSQIPTHGVLTSWAKQGVLLLNKKVPYGKTEVQQNKWRHFTTRLLEYLSNERRNIAYILFGSDARKISHKLNPQNNLICEWLDPSISTLDKPFSDCDCFHRVDHFHRKYKIYWESVVEEEKQITREIIGGANDRQKTYVFTDGGSKRAGKGERWIASWAYTIVRQGSVRDRCGFVGDIPSSNRAELSAIYNALLDLDKNLLRSDIPEEILIISDSMYSINTLGSWYAKWLSNPELYKLDEKKNIDLIRPAYEALVRIRQVHKVSFQHVSAHKREPENRDARFFWWGNDRADAMCSKLLKCSTSNSNSTASQYY